MNERRCLWVLAHKGYMVDALQWLSAASYLLADPGRMEDVVCCSGPPFELNFPLSTAIISKYDEQ